MSYELILFWLGVVTVLVSALIFYDVIVKLWRINHRLRGILR